MWLLELRLDCKLTDMASCDPSFCSMECCKSVTTTPEWCVVMTRHRWHGSQRRRVRAWIRVDWVSSWECFWLRKRPQKSISHLAPSPAFPDKQYRANDIARLVWGLLSMLVRTKRRSQRRAISDSAYRIQWDLCSIQWEVHSIECVETFMETYHRAKYNAPCIK